MVNIYTLKSQLYGTSNRIVILNFPATKEMVEKMVNEAARNHNQKGDWQVVNHECD